jgi:hypothetical protein
MRVLGNSLLAILGAASLVAQSADVPLTNWTVPPYTHSTSGGITTMTDVTPPRLFVGITPCRIADTRGNGAPITGGIFPNSGLRTWDVTNICGIPLGADAVSVNFSVVSPAGTPLGAFLLAWPTGQAAPPTAVMTYGPGATVISNAAIVPLGVGEQMNVNVSHSTHVILDVNGYFSDTLQTPANYLEVTNNSENWTALFTNNSTVCSGPCGLLVNVGSGDAIRGHSSASSGSGPTAGVIGSSSSPSENTSGVLGRVPGVLTSAGYGPAGVRGEGAPTGVLGLAPTYGVVGDLVQNNTILARGILGYEGGATDYGVWAQSNYGGTGAKFFVEPHPNDASKVIRYVSLEGPEAGTYFRGRGRFERGIARIAVPEDFRMVTDADGLSVQLTPIGPMATVSVVRYDLNEIVVQSSRNVEFFYLVQGVRRTHKHLSPIGEGTEYRPERANATMPAYLTEAQKQLLIQNGTYRPDGTVNMETARRLGWDRIWE